MNSRSLPVLWLAGPPGAGKTTVARRVWQRLRDDGVAAAYVSIDQLGMCVPAATDDPHRHALKLANLAAVIPGYAAAGADCLVMCGVVDARRIRQQVATLSGAEVTMVQLRLSLELLRPRLVAREWAPEMVDAALAEARLLRDQPIADAVVDTDGLAVDAVADRVLDRFRGRPSGGDAEAAAPVTADGEILWLCGTRAVGKSSVGFAAFAANAGRDRATGFVDLEQIGCLPDRSDEPRGHALKARNLAAIWRVYREHGARYLVVNGPLDSAASELVYREALPNARFTVLRLDAGVAALTWRVARRGAGHGWAEPGDDLAGRSEAELAAVVERAGREAERLAVEAVGHDVVATDGRDVDTLGRAVIALAGW